MQRRDLVRQAPKRGIKIWSWLARLLSAGIVSTDKDVVRRQRCVNIAVFATAANSASHLIFNAVYDFQGLLPLHIYNAAMMVVPLFIPRLHRLGENTGAITLALLILVAHMFVVWAMGISSDLHVYYIFGGAFLLAYAIYRKDPVFILGQAAGFLVYGRNLMLIRKKHLSTRGTVPAA